MNNEVKAVDVSMNDSWKQLVVSDKVFPALKKRILDYKVGDVVTATITGKVTNIGIETYWDKNKDKETNVMRIKLTKIKI